mgnify:CR=1 FL=1
MRDHSPVELVLLVTAALLLAPIVGTVVVSAAPVENQAYAVAQGTSCTVVDPVVDEDQNATAFYDYRNPDPTITGNPPSNTYSSFGTTEYQETHTSTFFIYEGSEDASLVVVNGRLGDEAGGSTLTMTFEGLPADGEWVIEDDEYPGRDDEWDVGETTTTVDWKWGDNRTDGGVYSGVGNFSGTITVTPAFNEEAAAWGDWGFSGSDEYRMDAWRVLGADGTEVELDRDRQLFIHGGGCEVTPPSAALTGPTTAETGESVTLDASQTTDDGALGGYEWDLDGDGETDQVTTDPTLEHTFSESRNYTVTVTAFDTYGNGDTAELAVNVSQPASPPEPALSAPEQVTVNDTVTLDASGSTDEGTITGYEWDFDGDGTVDANTTDPTVQHAYGSLGTVAATVTVVDDDGDRASASQDIDVLGPNQPPNASLDAPAAADEDTQVTLDASASTDDRDIDEYRWDFDGDGDIDTETAEASVVHTFADPGNVTVSVTVVDSNGETDRATASIRIRNVDDPPNAALTAPETATVNQTVTLDASGSTDDFGVQRYEWDFDGDGTVDATTTSPTVQHAYSTVASDVEASVTVVDTGNRTDTATATLDVRAPNQPPSAGLTAPANATVGDAVTFDASASTDDRGIATYRWDFDGDGTVERETEDPVAEYTYGEAGAVTAELVVVDTDGETASTNATVQVAPANDTPTAALSAPEEVARNETVTLDASGSSDLDGIQRYEWDFDGDGTIDATTTDPVVQHAFGTAGTYDVTVAVVDVGGRSANTAATTVVDSRTPLRVSLNAPGTATVNQPVTLQANVSGGEAEDGGETEIERYEWDLDGDGDVERETDGPTIEHTFETAGRVTVGVTAVSDEESPSATSALVVGDPSAVNTSIRVTTDSPTAGEPVSFEAAVSSATEVTSYAWQFGDGATGSGASVQHTYGSAGTYEVTLELTTAGGVTTSTTTSVSVAAADTGNGGNDGGAGDGGGNGDAGGGGNNPGGNDDDSNDGGGNDGNDAGGGQQGGGQQSGGQQGGSQDAGPEPEADIGEVNVSLGSERLLTGETLVVEATVENAGDATGTKTVEFEVEGQLLEERELTLAPGERRTVTFQYTFDSAGEKTVEVDHGRKRTVVVDAREPNLTVSALAVDERQVETGEEFTLTATITNDGTAAGERTVNLGLFGEQVAAKNVSVPVGESVEVTFTRAVMAPGSYEATVGNESVTVDVVGTDTTASGSDTGTASEAPGFGAVVAVLALLGTVLALRRRD